MIRIVTFFIVIPHIFRKVAFTGAKRHLYDANHGI